MINDPDSEYTESPKARFLALKLIISIILMVILLPLFFFMLAGPLLTGAIMLISILPAAMTHQYLTNWVAQNANEHAQKEPTWILLVTILVLIISISSLLKLMELFE